MKKACILLALALILTMTGCGNTSETTPAETTAPVQSVPVELTIEGLDYAEDTVLDAFWVSGTIISGNDLDRMEVSGTLTSDALGISVSADQEVFHFEDGIRSYQMSDLNDYFNNYINAMYELYDAAASLLGADDSQNVRMTATVYDDSGASVSVDLSFDLYDQDMMEVETTVDTLSIIDLETAESGSLEAFWINGTIASNVPLVSLNGHGKAESDVIAITVTDMADPYYFEEGVTSVDLADLKDYLLENMETIFSLFGLAAGEHEVPIEYIWECTDEAGNTVELTIHYTVTE